MSRPSITVRLRVNGRPTEMKVAASTRLLELLRSELRLTGTKEGCDGADCGACTVLIDDQPTLACLVLAAELEGRSVTTIETDADERIARLREAFLDESALQCGYCTPGMIMAASRIPPGADAETIRAALAGNVCRCTGYLAIVRAVQRAHRRMGRGHAKS